MIRIDNGGGLCMTCNNSPTCFYRASRGPGLFCEMFDDYTEPVVRTIDRRVSPKVESRGSEQDTFTYTGLCSNCDHRRTCALSKPEGGVWHCEEYR